MSALQNGHLDVDRITRISHQAMHPMATLLEEDEGHDAGDRARAGVRGKDWCNLNAG